MVKEICNPFQYSCLENSRDKGTWLAIVHGLAKHQTQPQDQHGSPMYDLYCPYLKIK